MLICNVLALHEEISQKIMWNSVSVDMQSHSFVRKQNSQNYGE